MTWWQVASQTFHCMPYYLFNFVSAWAVMTLIWLIGRYGLVHVFYCHVYVLNLIFSHDLNYILPTLWSPPQMSNGELWMFKMPFSCLLTCEWQHFSQFYNSSVTGWDSLSLHTQYLLMLTQPETAIDWNLNHLHIHKNCIDDWQNIYVIHINLYYVSLEAILLYIRVMYMYEWILLLFAQPNDYLRHLHEIL